MPAPDRRYSLLDADPLGSRWGGASFGSSTLLGELGAYSILQELGSGGMGRVHLAELLRPTAGLDRGRRVALKVIHPHLLATEGFFKRFLREAQVGQAVQHDNVVRTYDCDAVLREGQQHNFLVMEYVEGQTLRDLLRELGRVPEELCRHIAREIARGLAAIHGAGIVHRDVKPENVLITEEQVVKIMDLGVARLKDEAIRLSQAGGFVGSLEYAAPEQIQSMGRELDGRADLFALGVLLYELSTGQHPFRDEDARQVLHRILEGAPRRAGEVNPQLSPFFEEVVHQLLRKQRDERFADAGALLEVLEAGEEGAWWQERARELRIQTKQPLRRMRVPRDTALYGRDDELAKLAAIWQKVRSAQGQVLLVEGEAGIGKTRLVDEFVGRLQQDGEAVNFLFGSYPPGGAATAAGAFSTAYREQFGKEGLEETLADYLVESPVLIPAFAALLRGESTPTGAEALTKDSLQTVFVHATRALAAEHPTIVLIDDLHFAPEDGRALFASLALALEGHRVLLVGTSRPGMDEDWVANVERASNAARIALSRLGAKDLIELLKDAFRSERLATELGLQIAVKSDGNPFFAFEIIRGLREGDFITQSGDGTWVSTRVIQDIQIPSSVMDLVHARLRDLSEEERELLDVAACCGFEFNPSLVAEVVGLKRIPTLRAFGRIENEHRLVRSTGRDFAFDHYQVQEALYQGQPARLREEYHAAIAEALEDSAGAAEKDPRDLDGGLCVDVCGHYLKGGRGKQALRYLDTALDHLEQNYLNDQALALADRALAVPGLLDAARRVEVLLRKAGRLGMLGRRKDQEAVLDEARAHAASTGDAAPTAQVEVATGSLLMDTSRYEEAKYPLRRALQVYGELADRGGEAEVEGVLGQGLYRQGALAEAREHLARQLLLAQETGDRAVEATATGTLGLVLHAQGEFEQARAHHERAGALHRELGSRAGELRCIGNLGNVIGSEGGSEEALAHYARAHALCKEIGHRQAEAIGYHNRGVQLALLGQRTEALESYEAALRVAHEVEFGLIQAVTPLFVGRLLEDGGDAQGAEAKYRESIALLHELRVRDEHAAGAHVALGALLARAGRSAESRVAVEQGLEIAEECGSPGARALAYAGLAGLQAVEAQRAQEVLREVQASMSLESRTLAWFALWETTKDPAHLDEAKRLLDHALSLASEEHRKTMLANVRLNREIAAAWSARGGGA